MKNRPVVPALGSADHRIRPDDALLGLYCGKLGLENWIQRKKIDHIEPKYVENCANVAQNGARKV